MNIVLNKCPECGGTEYEGETWIMSNATFGKCAQCKKCAIVLKSSPEYEKELDELVAAKQTPKRPAVICPYCQSTNTKKITAAGRAVSIGLLGLASSKVGKQWHCNGCGSDF